ncbi:inositol transporter-like SP family MFS transporter [Amycolatopsis bartoniae]|uniref:MFS transporter n=1 Tax=Amycolatopsis bartoniae TaxID=941986 RepID=A0A8H9J055_9PSEU|nr:MFS transporter [Amycolatopsis bartoniae]MBB2940080.1 inositol transporter-like SP family MFS transporter [Amycolatopsis bartoniae]TVT09443.1 MFS transporter [Amycolatopsis bartoniae]GHF53803.1 MFS transporter [Amycolatopsis bartoniae]
MESSEAVGVTPAEDTGDVTRRHWRWSVLAGMASYLDAGSIVALGSGLALFQSYLGLSDGAVGALAALGPNALGCALGAFLGGRLGDRLGRKRIYKYDLLVYGVGILLIALAFNAPMLFAGTFVVGVAVGADVPTSLALVGEFSPAKARGKLLAFTQIAWNAGPVVVLLLALALSSLDLLGIRIVFAMLFVVAIVTWALRQGLAESARWRTASTGATVHRVRALFRGRHLQALLWTASIYLFWNLAAGTSGIFTPYIIKTLRAGNQAASVALSCAGFVIGILVTVLFMRLVDRSHRHRRLMWGAGAVMQVLAYGVYLVFPFAIPVIIANIVLFGVGAGFAGEAMYKIFSQELFPTMLRGTAQGFTFGAARTVLGVWSFFVPTLAGAGIGPVAALLTVSLFISGVVGFFFMPDTAGKSLEQIEAERAA